MAKQPANAIWIALGAGIGVLLVDLLLGDTITEAIIRGILAALIAAALVTIVERRL